jgi:hypothetical protein
MQLILFAAAAWSIALGLHRAFALRTRATRPSTDDPVGDWVGALSLVGAGLWAWESESWLALVGGYAIGWAVLYFLPVSPQRARSRSTA